MSTDLELLGHGLDAIIFRTRARRRGCWLQRFLDRVPALDRHRLLLAHPVLPLNPPSADARLDRYHQAREWIDPAGIEHFALRRDIGQLFQDAWKRGHWPKLSGVHAARALFAGIRR